MRGNPSFVVPGGSMTWGDATAPATRTVSNMSLDELFLIMVIAAAVVTLAGDLIARYLAMRDAAHVENAAEQTRIDGSALEGERTKGKELR
jgi:hypothetical protein